MLEDNSFHMTTFPIHQFIENGFRLPGGFSWNVNLVNGVIHGKVTIYDEYGSVAVILNFVNGVIEGECKFYDSGCLYKKQTFVNNVENGWCILYDDYREAGWLLYENGEKKYEYQKHQSLQNYWLVIDSEKNMIVRICKLNPTTHRAYGKGYVMKHAKINRVVEYEDDKEIRVLKFFDNSDKMHEFDDNGRLVYLGDYKFELAQDVPREGHGKEFEDGNLVYEGEWTNNKRHGIGRAIFNGMVCYIGEWEDGYAHGNGKVIKDDEVVFEGEFQWGRSVPCDSTWIHSLTGNQITPEKKVVQCKEELLEIVSLKDYAKKETIVELTVGENCCNDVTGDLTICQFPNLQVFTINKCSLREIQSLTVRDNLQLQFFKAEGHDRGSCFNTRELVLKSLFFDNRSFVDLPMLEEFFTGCHTFTNMTVLALRGGFLSVLVLFLSHSLLIFHSLTPKS